MEIDRSEPQEKMASYSPWKRRRSEQQRGLYHISCHSFWEKFDYHINANIDLDIDSKRIALAASPWVASLVSYTGGNILFMGSGTIIESEEVNGTFLNTILTSSSLLRRSTGLDDVPDDIKINVFLSEGKLFDGEVFAYDFHFNVAAIKIKSDSALPIARLGFLDDSISIDPSVIRNKRLHSESFEFHPHLNMSNLCPRDSVVAIGRYFERPHEIMAASGKFSLDSCNFDCKELFTANCTITKCGIGGPLLNNYGEVIGVNFYDKLCTPFLPINIAYKCLEHFKKYGRFNRPSLGMEMTNIYATRLDQLEEIILKFPNHFRGILVEKVVKGSPADCAGILPSDVIVQCDDNIIQSFLEFLGLIWDKVGESVEVMVIRTKTGAHLNLTIKIEEVSPKKFNRTWLRGGRSNSRKRDRIIDFRLRMF